MDYEQKYKEALERMKSWARGEHPECFSEAKKAAEFIFPELKESEDEKIRRKFIEALKGCGFTHFDNEFTVQEAIAWLEKQGDNNKWKPSKDEMDALYGLAYITNKMDDKKDKAITKLYQDLKREFFNGASYENMFPLSSIDSSINIEKQGENTYNKELSELLHKVVCKFINSPDIPYSEREKVSKKIIPYVEQLEKQGEQKSADKIEPKFNVGDWVVQGHNVLKIRCVGNEYYCFETVGGYVDDMLVSEIDSLYHLWTIEDAKDGDVLVFDGIIMIFKSIKTASSANTYILYYNRILFDDWCDFGHNAHPATKEQRDFLFQKMHEVGYGWCAETKQLIKFV